MKDHTRVRLGQTATMVRRFAWREGLDLGVRPLPMLPGRFPGVEVSIHEDVDGLPLIVRLYLFRERRIRWFAATWNARMMRWESRDVRHARQIGKERARMLNGLAFAATPEELVHDVKRYRRAPTAVIAHYPYYGLEDRVWTDDMPEHFFAIKR